MTQRILEFVTPGDPNDLFKLEKELAVGSFGTVYSALNKNTGEKVAVKIITLEEDETFDDLITEIDILRRSSHPNIVKYYGSWLKGRELFIVMELCSGGSLLSIYEDFPKNEIPCTENQIAFVLRETLKGLAYLHGVGIIHRDIKAANILLTEKGEIKLADFGVSAQLTKERPYRYTLIGTPYWMAPEVISMDSNSPYNEKADIWSLGITAIELAEKNPPLVDLAPMRALCVIPFEPPPTFKEAHKWSLNFFDFVQCCLRKAPVERRPCAELLKHPFVANCSEDSLSKLVDAHRKIETQNEEHAQNLAKKWEKFLGEIGARGSVYEENQETQATYESETTVVKKKMGDSSASSSNLASSGPGTPNSSAPSTPTPEAKPTHKRQLSQSQPGGTLAKATIIDPSTNRPRTIIVDESNGRVVENQGQVARQIVKKQLKEIQRIQKGHVKVNEQLGSKHQNALEQLFKNYQSRVKQKEKQRVEMETQAQKQHQLEKEAMQKEHSLQIKGMAKQLVIEDKQSKRDFEIKQKFSFKDFKDNLKVKSKEQKKVIKTKSGTQKKMSEKELQNDLQFEEMRFLQFLTTQKMTFGHKQQFQILERHLLKQQIQMDEIHKLQFANMRQVNQIKSDFQLLVQESMREFLQQQQQLQITHLQHTHVTAQDQLQLVLKVSREQQKKQMDSEMKQQIKDFRAKLKTQQVDQQKEEKEYKRQLTQEALSKKEVEQLQKAKKEAHKEKLLQKEKEFETTLLQKRGLEEKQLMEVQERQYRALINAQERERRNMDM